MNLLLIPLLLGLLAPSALVAQTGDDSKTHSTNNLPLAIVCTDAEVRNYAYLTRVEPDGTAVYMTPTSIALTVSPDGPVEAVGGANVLGDCADKTLTDLTESGQSLLGGD